jgi:hypothetical protein
VKQTLENQPTACPGWNSFRDVILKRKPVTLSKRGVWHQGGGLSLFVVTIGRALLFRGLRLGDPLAPVSETRENSGGGRH